MISIRRPCASGRPSYDSAPMGLPVPELAYEQPGVSGCLTCRQVTIIAAPQCQIEACRGVARTGTAGLDFREGYGARPRAGTGR